MKIVIKFLRVEEDEIFFFKNYSIYRIESEFEDGEICSVERRMSEFQQLWDLLKEIYPSQLIPPLPESIKVLKCLVLKCFNE